MLVGNSIIRTSQPSKTSACLLCNYLILLEYTALINYYIESNDKNTLFVKHVREVSVRVVSSVCYY